MVSGSIQELEKPVDGRLIVLKVEASLKPQDVKKFIEDMPSTPNCEEIRYAFYEGFLVFELKFIYDYDCKQCKKFINSNPKSKKFFGPRSEARFFKIKPKPGGSITTLFFKTSTKIQQLVTPWLLVLTMLPSSPVSPISCKLARSKPKICLLLSINFFSFSFKT